MRVQCFTILALCLSLSCTKKDNKSAESQAALTQQQQNITELKIEDLVVGEGAVAEKGQTVEVHYVGTFLDGKKFDSSIDRNQTFPFKLGAGQVIKGWDQGVAGMKVGGKRRLTIPAELAYGARGAGSVIPPNTPLLFEVSLINIK